MAIVGRWWPRGVVHKSNLCTRACAPASALPGPQLQTAFPLPGPQPLHAGRPRGLWGVPPWLRACDTAWAPARGCAALRASRPLPRWRGCPRALSEFKRAETRFGPRWGKKRTRMSWTSRSARQPLPGQLARHQGTPRPLPATACRSTAGACLHCAPPTCASPSTPRGASPHNDRPRFSPTSSSPLPAPTATIARTRESRIASHSDQSGHPQPTPAMLEGPPGA